MEQKMLDELRNKSREERLEYFKANKSALMEAALESISGGAAAKGNENPHSSCPYKGNWYTSWGWVCNGVKSCG